MEPCLVCVTKRRDRWRLHFRVLCKRGAGFHTLGTRFHMSCQSVGFLVYIVIIYDCTYVSKAKRNQLFDPKTVLVWQPYPCTKSAHEVSVCQKFNLPVAFASALQILESAVSPNGYSVLYPLCLLSWERCERHIGSRITFPREEQSTQKPSVSTTECLIILPFGTTLGKTVHSPELAQTEPKSPNPLARNQGLTCFSALNILKFLDGREMKSNIFP